MRPTDGPPLPMNQQLHRILQPKILHPPALLPAGHADLWDSGLLTLDPGAHEESDFGKESSVKKVLMVIL